MRAANSTAEPAAVSGIDSAELRALGAGLVRPELVIFPVRHHSPGCAWQIRRLMAQSPPCEVLVEGPRSFTPLLPLLTHAEARMPLAIYTYAVRKAQGEQPEQRRAAYYPFCDYSPELVALREAQQRGIPTQFIDLDFTEQCAAEREAGDEAESLLDEQHYQRSGHLRALAQQLGCRDQEELWEHLFEVPALAREPAAHIADIAAWCQLARLDSRAEELAADGTVQREAEMAWHIREALARRQPGQGPVLAVMGGFHAVVMPGLLARPPPRPQIRVGAIGDEASALIRYSFERLDRLNGYSAGMTSPAWQQLVWEQALRRERAGLDPSPRLRHEAALGLLFDIAGELRGRHQLPLPMPAMAAAYEQMLRLAALRRRSAPVRDDVLDAVTSCFIKGDADADGALVRAVARRAFTGETIGRVPPGASRPPLVKDFLFRARRQRLKIDDADPRRAALDLYRRPEHRVTSRLFHGLGLLGIPLAMRSAGPDFVSGFGLDRLQEHWEYSYSVAAEAALVEASVYGVTVPLAVANRYGVLLDELERGGRGNDARAATGLLVQACVLGLHDHLPRVLAVLRGAVGADAAFDAVASATGSLGLLWESREPLEARDIAELPLLLQAAYERAIYLGRELRGAPENGTPVVRALSLLRELLSSAAGRALDASLYWAMVESLRQHHDMALIRGAAAGLLYSAGRMDEATLGQALDGHLNGINQPREAVAFLRGLLQTAREAAWQQPALLQVLDRLLRQWDEEAFVTTLPELRLAFAELTPKETDRVAEAVAQLHGASNLGRLVSHDISAAQVQANLELTRGLREVLDGEGLKEWAA